MRAFSHDNSAASNLRPSSPPTGTPARRGDSILDRVFTITPVQCPSRRMKVLRQTDFEYRQLRSAKTGEEFSRSSVLSSVLGAKDFFIHHEILSPGRRASSPHVHMQTDEFIYVLKGQPTLIEGTEELTLGPGDCGIFSAGSPQLHVLENRSHEDAEVLVVSKKLSEPDVNYALPEK